MLWEILYKLSNSRSCMLRATGNLSTDDASLIGRILIEIVIYDTQYDIIVMLGHAKCKSAIKSSAKYEVTATAKEIPHVSVRL